MAQNTFFNFFKKLIPTNEVKEIKEAEKNAQAQGYVDPDLIALQKQLISKKDDGVAYFNDVSKSNTDFINIVNSKRSKVIRYNQMRNYPEIYDATEIIVNESITKDESDQICKFTAVETEEKIPDNIKKLYAQAFNTVYYDLYDFNKTADIFYEKLFVEGELFIELIPDSKKEKIIGYQILPSYTMLPIYNKMNIIEKFVQINDIKLNTANKKGYKLNKDEILKEFALNQIIYLNSGKYGDSLYDVRSSYDVVMKTYNHMKMIDDSLAIYRWTRAPEMRVFNVYTGRMQSGPAKNYIKNLAKRYNKVNDYNYETGEISQKSHIKSIIDDIWFAVGEDGNKTEIDSIAGGMQLGELEDVKMFISKLYKGLGIPRGRWDSEEMGEWDARSESITRDEQQFAQKLEKLKRNFEPIITDAMKIILKMLGVDDKYIDTKYMKIIFNVASKYQLYLKNEIWSTKLEMYETAADYIYDSEDVPNGFLNREWVLTNICGFTDEELRENADLIVEQKKNEPKEED